eukprot:15348644-Ditylum_brightwellii.AAC.1
MNKNNMNNRKRNNYEANGAEQGSSTKKQKQHVELDLICPITLELPFDPVHAEDGCLYERKAIECHFATTEKSEEKVRSPTKGILIGEHIVAAPHIKNIIDNLICNGIITGDKANKWKETAKEQKFKDDLLKQANNGNAQAMYEIGYNYAHGTKGFEKDYKHAYTWYNKSNAAGSIRGMVTEGECLLRGYGVEHDAPTGMLYLGMAEGQGCDFAAFKLGFYLAKESKTCPKKKMLACKMLEKVVSGKYAYKRLYSTSIKEAKEMLDHLQSSDV